MASKLWAARLASWSGVRAIIAQAQRANVVIDAVEGKDVGTTFQPSDRRLPARKLWIGFASDAEGVITVDDGARRALVERGTSLLPAGVRDVQGEFEAGATVEVHDLTGQVFARGMTVSSSAIIRQTAGRQTKDLRHDIAHEVIHRDDFVLLPY